MAASPGMVEASHAASGRTIRAIVKCFHPVKGYGFLEPKDCSADVFCQLTAAQASGHDTLTSERSFSAASSVFLAKPCLAQKLGQVRRINRNAMFRLQPGNEIRHGDVRLGLYLRNQGIAVAS